MVIGETGRMLLITLVPPLPPATRILQTVFSGKKIDEDRGGSIKLLKH
jgi:hypothetical protein